ncbi:MAG: metal-dependent hydrolase [Burkholderiaceae bacterium]|nr:metal-dependent hydrolase [Burkholderiaceae bacterium]
MPFTPLHMGPGLLVKSLLQGSFSLMVFGWTQILMDIQPLWVMLTGHGHLHGFSHTYLGATLLGIAAAFSGKYVAEFGLYLLSKRDSLPISWPVAISSALIGSFSHVLLDSIMHADVEPFFPFVQSNVFLGILSIETLHKFCIYSGLIGAGLYAAVSYYLQKTISINHPSDKAI